MKINSTISILIIGILFVLFGCNNSDELSPITEQGRFFNNGSGSACGIKIELNTGEVIIPQNWPTHLKDLPNGDPVELNFKYTIDGNISCSAGKMVNVLSVDANHISNVVVWDRKEKIHHDVVQLKDVSINGDILTLEIAYSGGCELHEFKLFVAYPFCNTPPVPPYLILSHNANSDPCEAFLTRKLHFNLSSLRKHAQGHELKYILSVKEPHGNTYKRITYQF
ncbi:hypothetical protein EMN47_00085 [Prolixibacteraceae bacterium JC049]|nr:hypothetical protein [Prolixibacteraceae bacterium JC049]